MLIISGCSTISVKQSNGFGQPYEGTKEAYKNGEATVVLLHYKAPPTVILTIPFSAIYIATHIIADTILLPIELLVTPKTINDTNEKKSP